MEWRRRKFLETLAVTTAGLAGGVDVMNKNWPWPKDIDATNIPRWRGFNLLEKFILSIGNEPFREKDFELIARLGFDFVRLPMSYWCWSDPHNWKLLREKPLKEIDEAVNWGKQYGVHVNLNFHRGPGYTVDRSAPEPFNLWLDEEAQQAFDFHWRHFAERYKGISNRQVSFNLLNEPATLTSARLAPIPPDLHDKVMRRTVQVIRDVDPQRLIFLDGLWWGREPIPSLTDLGVVQSTRGYEPIQITHYQASWVDGAKDWPAVDWPMGVPVPTTELRWATSDMNNHYLANLKKWGLNSTTPWDVLRIKKQMIGPWKALEKKGVKVHVGEFGAFNQTPHTTVLRWLGDLMNQWKKADWGWAMWNFRGAFGILDSGRKDVNYENFHGHQLDRKMLELIQRY